MAQLDHKNMRALRLMRISGRIVALATKEMEKQRRIRKEVKNEFQVLLNAYPEAKKVYYNQ